MSTLAKKGDGRKMILNSASHCTCIRNSEDNQIQSDHQSRELKLTERFTKSIGDLFHDKCRAESKLASHLLEVSGLGLA